MLLHPNEIERTQVQVAKLKFDHFEYGLASQIKLSSQDGFFGLVYTYHGRDTKKVLEAIWIHINEVIPAQFNEPAWDVLIIFNNQEDLDLFVEKIESNRTWPFNLQLVLKETVVWTTRLH